MTGQLHREDGSLTSDHAETRIIVSYFCKSLLTRLSFMHEQLALSLHYGVLSRRKLVKPFNVHEVYVAIEALGKNACFWRGWFPS